MGTEFAVQGLELDQVGVCWDLDLVHGPAGWQARAFRGTAWTAQHRAEALPNRLNAYRVLLTRARHGAVVWVPRGCPHDPTRTPALYDAVAAHLRECGARPLDEAAGDGDAPAMPEAILL